MLVGQVGLWIAALLTLITGYDYLAEGLKHVGEDTARVDERPKTAAKPARPIL
jgi:CDP-diacylglycerol---glycerol-3-phosphate 3-phosphatidyltransferase